MTRVRPLHISDLPDLPPPCAGCPVTVADLTERLEEADDVLGCIGFGIGDDDLVGVLLWTPPRTLADRLTHAGSLAAGGAVVIEYLRSTEQTPDRVLMGALITAAGSHLVRGRPWRALQIRGARHQPTCRAPDQDRLQRLGFVPRGPVVPGIPFQWLRLDLRPTIRTRPQAWRERLAALWPNLAPEVGGRMGAQRPFDTARVAGINEAREVLDV